MCFLVCRDLRTRDIYTAFQLGCKWILKQISGDCVVCAYGNVGLVELEPGVVVWGYWIWDVSCMYVFGWGVVAFQKRIRERVNEF